MRLDVYVNYNGECERAFRFYEQQLGGRITGIVRHGEQPNPRLPAEWQEKVLHARIEIGSTVLMGADIPQAEPMRSAYLTLSLDREEDAERVYDLLTDGGEVFMKMEKTPFANRFAMLRDRFGASWMLLHQPASAGNIVNSIEAEFRRYKALAEGAMRQLQDADLSRTRSTADNSVATIAWHISGNLKSRFTDFLNSDGEKPWRDRESEFRPRDVGRAELEAKWEEGWQTLFAALVDLRDEDLDRLVSIRGVPLRVSEALHRSLAHASYHVGQIVFVSKMLRGEKWDYLSIPPGASDAYNRQPTLEKPGEHAAHTSARAADDRAEGSS